MVNEGDRLNPSRPCPPFLLFPDQGGNFLLFAEPWAVFESVHQAERAAQEKDGWLAGGLPYPDRAAAPESAGWWGVFPRPQTQTLAQVKIWADQGPVFAGPLVPEVSPVEYQHAFEQVHAALKRGDSYQVNLTFRLRGRAASGQAWGWPSALRLWLDAIPGQTNAACFAVLGTKEQPFPVVVSASPELFFRQEGSTVWSKPMKGTAPASSSPDLTAKLKAENLMITDMVRNDLGQVAVPGSVAVPQLFEWERYPTVWQLTSTVRAGLPPSLTFARLAEALFPAASITGAPKHRTREIIAQVEASPRGWYTGTLGWHRPASAIDGPALSRFSVLIRTLVFEDDEPRFVLGVGGGIVWDSQVNDEWDEALTKARFLKPVQRDFDLVEALLWQPETGYSLLKEHTARLSAACRDFGGTWNQTEWDELLANASAGLTEPSKVRVLLSPDFRLAAEAETIKISPGSLSYALAAEPCGPETLLWRRYKTTRRGIYNASRVPGADQTLHFNQRGELTESTTMNVVLEIGGKKLTPALSSGLLDGTLRRHLVDKGELKEQVLLVDDLKKADRVWLINSVRGWCEAHEL